MATSAPVAHTIMFSDLQHAKQGQHIQVDAEEAHHAAKVKRVRPGERLGLLDGCGHTATGILIAVTGSKARPGLDIEIEQINTAEPINPNLEVYTALPKGDHLDRMIDQLTQLGVSTFRPLLCERSQRKPETVRTEKLTRIASEAMKQCRRPWALKIEDPIPFHKAVGDPDAVIADATGDAWDRNIDSAPRTVILIGPEGGWSDQERAEFADSPARIRRFGPFVLRIEAAAAASSAMVMGI